MNIPREEVLQSLKAFAANGSGVVIGPPGVGKTFLLTKLWREVSESTGNALYLAIDRIAASSEREIAHELGLETDLIAHLKQHPAQQPGLLIIDAFDAARSETKQMVFLNVIRRALRELRGLWNVVVSVRTYDARKSLALQGLFPREPDGAPPKYQLPDVDCRHFAIPPLSREEVSASVSSISGLASLYSHASEELRELLRIPFNLWLAERLLSRQAEIAELSGVNSDVQLLAMFWWQRVSAASLGTARAVLLSQVTKAMVDQRALSVRLDELFGIEWKDVWQGLLSDEVLVSVSTTHQRVAYAHNILFDFAVSVLLIEDEAEQLIGFLKEDESRSVFLRPSLTYYFSRLWYEARLRFWQVFWHLQGSTDPGIRLFAQIVPVAVIANEATGSADLVPLLEKLRTKEPLAATATSRVLQAYRTFSPARDTLWGGFCAEAAQWSEKEFAWDLALVANAVLARAKSSGNHAALASAGTAGRRLLVWIWGERAKKKERFLDTLGATWVVPIVAQAFGTAPSESEATLEPILGLTRETDFPIDYLFRLAVHVNSIWDYAPAFVAQFYDTVFAHPGESDSPTSFGGFVLSFQSTRRQDFHMVQYDLAKQFGGFLLASEAHAFRAAILSTNSFVIRDHVVRYLREGVSLSSVTEHFLFRGQMATYIPDGSSIWGQGIVHIDEPTTMLDELFRYVERKTEGDEPSPTVETLLDVLAEHARVAVSWKRIIETGAARPKAIGHLLLDLCVAVPVQRGLDTREDLRKLLQQLGPQLSDAQLHQVEQSISLLPSSGSKDEEREHLGKIRDHLLSALPHERLTTEEGRAVRDGVQAGEEVALRESVSIVEEVSREFTETDWFRERGVDTETPSNQALMQLSTPFEDFAKEWMNKIPALDAAKGIVAKLEISLPQLDLHRDADRTVIDATWTKLAACASLAARATDDPSSGEFSVCRQLLLMAADHEDVDASKRTERRFDFPAWGPIPKTEAAQGLAWLAARRLDSDIAGAITRLAADPLPEVRFLMALELFRVIGAGSDFFWNTIRARAADETNSTVKGALCRALSYAIARQEEKGVEILRLLIGDEVEQGLAFELDECPISLIVWLSVERENKWADEFLTKVLSMPHQFAKSLQRATFQLLTFVTPQALNAEQRRLAAERGILWLHKVLDAVVAGVRASRSAADGQLGVQHDENLKALFLTVDEVVSRLLFALDGSQKNGEVESIPQDYQRVFFESIRPLLEHVIEASSQEGTGALLAPTAHHFMELLNRVLQFDPPSVLALAVGVSKASRPAGYSFDSLAIREVVNLVEAILADYRKDVQSGPALRDLIALLDIFSEAGWQEALRLVWRLDEIFR